MSVKLWSAFAGIGLFLIFVCIGLADILFFREWLITSLDYLFIILYVVSLISLIPLIPLIIILFLYYLFKYNMIMYSINKVLNILIILIKINIFSAVSIGFLFTLLLDTSDSRFYVSLIISGFLMYMHYINYKKFKYIFIIAISLLITYLLYNKYHDITSYIIYFIIILSEGYIIFMKLKYEPLLFFEKIKSSYRLTFAMLFVFIYINNITYIKLYNQEISPLFNVIFSFNKKILINNINQNKIKYDKDPFTLVNSNHAIYDFKIDSRNKLLYFSDKGDPGAVGKVDLTSGITYLSKRIFYGLEQLVLSEDSKYVYAYNKIGESVVPEIDTTTLEPIRLCKAEGSVTFIDMAATPFPEYLVAIKEYEPRVFWLNKKTCEMKILLTHTWDPYQVICHDKQLKCYISGWFYSATLSEISIFPNRVPENSRHRLLGPFSIGMALDRDNNKLYISRPLVGCIDVIDVITFKRIRRIPCAPMVRAVACAPNLDLLFLPTYFEGVLYIHSISTGKKLGQLHVGKYVREIVWDEVLETLFISDIDTIYSINAGEILNWIEKSHSKI